MMDSVIPTKFVYSRGRVGGRRLLEVPPRPRREMYDLLGKKGGPL